MKKTLLPVLFVVGFISFSTAQKKSVSLEEIWRGDFSTQGMVDLRSMNNGKEYTVLNTNWVTKASTIDKYSYKTLEKTGTIVDGMWLPGISDFSSYTFSKDESKILLATEVESIFRHSTLGIYYVYDIASKKTTKISDSKIQEPTLSPDGSKVAYVRNNNLYIFDLNSQTVDQITTDGEKNKIINGVTDWVYEEEFAFVRAFEWSPDGNKIAFLRFDESQVPEFSMDVYDHTLYPSEDTFKYPKAGENNSVVTLHLVDVNTKRIDGVDLGNPYYIPRIKWKSSPDELAVQTINRHQDDLKLYTVNVDKNSVSLLLEETDKAYVDVTDDLTFLDDDSFIWTSERDGHNHIYLYTKDGKLKNQVTKGKWEVTQYYGYDRTGDRLYYQSTENGSINRDVYSIDSKGKNKKRLTDLEGTNGADFSTDFTYFINTFSSATYPPAYSLYEAKTGNKLKGIKDNGSLLEKLNGYKISPKEFSTLSINGNDLNMWMIKPMDFDPAKKYPLLMFQYSGPGSQKVANSWMGTNDYWYEMLASEGYIIACVDGRGTGFKGRDFKKVTYKELGRYEVEDQIASARKLSELPYIDAGRTGIWGWSYGGFMASNCILKGNDVFEMAIAVAPVTSWRFYDSIYTERFMQTPQENPKGYDENSPLSYPELLKGKYLLIHGSADDNVHLQNSMRLIEALIQANKQFNWAIYPDKDHGISGGNTRLQLYTKMTNFIKENL
ncbi:S9 family peptidase [Flavobacteriaceae bacterium F89]|uniref:S9 family peptidase n=1 Tax=Cerina litoralis TaxID=2874477 RepID=A0AAE3JQ60_9FLAO|nr:S9 family peptidase [Cerina litoralis]MCG2461761.1 S9 family peptidase [Cerina litoralis]